MMPQIQQPVWEWQQKLAAVQTATEDVLTQHTQHEQAAVDQARSALRTAEREQAQAQTQLDSLRQQRTQLDGSTYARRVGELTTAAQAYADRVAGFSADLETAQQRLIQAKQRTHQAISQQLENELAALHQQANIEIAEALAAVQRIKGEWETKIQEARQRRQSFGAVMPLS